MDHYRQQQAAVRRAAMFKAQAELLEKQAAYEQLQQEHDVYMGAAAPPAAAPIPALPLQMPAEQPAGDGWSFGRIVGTTVLVVLALFTGAVWTEAGHRAGKLMRQADMQGSWGNSVPEDSSYREPARPRMTVRGLTDEQ